MPADNATAAPTAIQTADSSSRQSLWMILAAFAFSAMGVCVKLASAHYSTGEIVFYRSVIGMTVMGAILAKTGAGIRTPYLMAHIKRSVFGVTSLLLWFTSISLLPLATAMTLNYMSPVWIALIIGAGAAMAGTAAGAAKTMVAAILMSFVGVLCLLQPSEGSGPSQLAGGMVGLVSGVFTALAYVEVRQLGDPGENEARIVFYQHDEVMVHCRREVAGAVRRDIEHAAADASTLLFGDTPVVFGLDVRAADSYADAH